MVLNTTYIQAVSTNIVYRIIFSKLAYVISITDPSTPKFSFSKTSVHSVSITIEKGSGCVHHYDIYVNGKMKKSVLASSERLNSVINNLDDGKTFKINVLSVSYGQNSSLPLALAAATSKIISNIVLKRIR